MQCHEFEQRWNEVLDERGNPAAEPGLAAHAEHCLECQLLLGGQIAFGPDLRRANVPPLPADFSRAVVRAAAPAAPRVARPHRAHSLLAAGVLFASAAAALVAVSLPWIPRLMQPVVAGNSGAQPAPSGGRGPLRPASRPLAVSASVAFTQGDLLLEMPRLGNHLREGIDDLAVALPETVERIDEAARHSRGIRPLRLSLSVLWDTLCRALPGVADDPPPASRPHGAGAALQAAWPLV